MQDLLPSRLAPQEPAWPLPFESRALTPSRPTRQPAASTHLQIGAAASPIEIESESSARGADAHIHANAKPPATKAPPRVRYAKAVRNPRAGNSDTAGQHRVVRAAAARPVDARFGSLRTANLPHLATGESGPCCISAAEPCPALPVRQACAWLAARTGMSRGVAPQEATRIRQQR